MIWYEVAMTERNLTKPVCRIEFTPNEWINVFLTNDEWTYPIFFATKLHVNKKYWILFFIVMIIGILLKWNYLITILIILVAYHIISQIKNKPSLESLVLTKLLKTYTFSNKIKICISKKIFLKKLTSFTIQKVI